MDNTKDHTFESANRIYGVNGLSPTIPTCAGGGIQPKVMEIQRIVYDDYNSAIRADQSTMTTLTTNCGASALRNGVKIIELQKECMANIPDVFQRFVYEIDGELYLIRIRKLTPLECWRLMGFTDADYEKAASVVSNTQLYKQAGNSIVKQVLMQVFSQMLTKQTRVSGLQKKALALLDML